MLAKPGPVWQTLEAVAVMAAAVGAWLFVPREVLVPACFAVLALGVGGVFAIKWYVRKLPPETHFEQRTLLLEAGFVLSLAAFVAFIVLVMEYA